jgi:hypothetical protein
MENLRVSIEERSAGPHRREGQMLVKIEIDLEDGSQIDLALEILSLTKLHGFHGGGTDTLRKIVPQSEAMTNPNYSLIDEFQEKRTSSK